MKNILIRLVACLLMTALGTGCASPPIPFQLVDTESKIQLGTIFPDGHRIEISVEGHLFSGFYIIASGISESETLYGRRLLPGETRTSYSSNSAHAHLTSDNAQQLNCEFLFESKRAIGQCSNLSGKVYQLSADGTVSGK